MSAVANLPKYDGLKRAIGTSSCRDRPSFAECSSFVVEAKKVDTFRSRREKRHQRIRKKLDGTSDRPRLSVFRSNKHIYAQVSPSYLPDPNPTLKVIDDSQSHTLCSASTLVKQVVDETEGKGSDKNAAYIVGKLLGERALEQGIVKVCFDRGGYLYHGRIKAVADGAREAGLDF